jgi:hypothetical protein
MSKRKEKKKEEKRERDRKEERERQREIAGRVLRLCEKKRKILGN